MKYPSLLNLNLILSQVIMPGVWSAISKEIFFLYGLTKKPMMLTCFD